MKIRYIAANRRRTQCQDCWRYLDGIASIQVKLDQLTYDLCAKCAAMQVRQMSTLLETAPAEVVHEN